MSGYIGTQPVPQATQTRDAFTATSGQTSFATSGYTPSFLDVYLNGIKMAAADYTASNGSDVVLASGAALDDILEVVAYTTFDTANVTGADDFTVTGSFTSQGIDDNATSTAMTLDGSGNLLVGKASDNNALEGISLAATGAVKATNSSDLTGIFNRLTTDGDIVQFWKNGSTVGSIGTRSGNIGIGNGDVGLEFNASNNDIYPKNVTTNSLSDANIDLGSGSYRFKDLYLSGGVYLGGTGSANKLDDYEEGTWTPSDASGDGLTLATNGSSYTKIGRLCYIYAYITYPSTASSSTQSVGGLPFTAKAGATYAQLTVRVTSDTVSAANLTFQVTTSATTGIIHDGPAGLVNADLSSQSILISGCYEVA